MCGILHHEVVHNTVTHEGLVKLLGTADTDLPISVPDLIQTVDISDANRKVIVRMHAACT